MRDFESELKSLVRGDVSFDELTLGIYSTDASIYQITPVALVQPKDEADVCTAVRAAAKYNISILPRGGGTSLNGQGCGNSMIIDFTKYMNQILELNVQEEWARVQPGVILDVLNAELARHGLQFAPDPATSSRATIGGMMGNNSSGTKSIIYGITCDHVLESKVLLSDGTVLAFKEISPAEYQKKSKGSGEAIREAEIYSGFKRIIEENREEIKSRFPTVMRRVQGYNLDAFTNTERWNLSKLIIGSEGTLGIFLESKLSLKPLPKFKVLCTVHFSDLLESIRTVSPILNHRPSAVEIMDEEIVTQARSNLNVRPLTSFIQGDPKAILVVEFFGETAEDAKEKAEALAFYLKSQRLGYAWPIITDLAEQAKVWSVRKKGLGLMLGMKGDRKPIPFIEDCCVPVDVLPEYIDRILKFCKQRDVQVAMYAHASVGTIHVRPVLNLKVQEDIDNMKAIAEFAFRLVKKYRGSWSGEHGDGRVRSPYLERFFGKKVYDAFTEVKRLFDPAGLMNPGVIVDPVSTDKHLRYGIDYKTPTAPTLYHYREDGSFAAAVEMCTGVGDCRQKLAGAMCPSYRATLEEEYSTRGRANALRLAMTGQLGPDGMTSKRLYEVMELCLSCKSCKSECPSNVDMARLKGEFLQNYYDVHGVPIRKRVIKGFPLISSIFSGLLAPFVNYLLETWLFKKAMEKVWGFDMRRKFPEYARMPFNRWFAKRSESKGSFNKTVALFCDTITNHHQPEIGKSALELLESCGYRVILADAGCCQRPNISHGFLRKAKVKGESTLRNLDRYIERGLKIVVLEPGCCSALVDDLPDLIDDVGLGNRIKENVMMIDEFLAEEVRQGNIKCQFVSPFDKIIIHGHCHQKAILGTTEMKYLLDRVPGMSAIELDSGCCGMGWDFGFEKRHYDLSMQIGEERLFPAVRNHQEGATVVACGFSCRNQIADGTGVKALHWVDTIRGTFQLAAYDKYE